MSLRIGLRGCLILDPVVEGLKNFILARTTQACRSMDVCPMHPSQPPKSGCSYTASPSILSKRTALQRSGSPTIGSTFTISRIWLGSLVVLAGAPVQQELTRDRRRAIASLLANAHRQRVPRQATAGRLDSISST